MKAEYRTIKILAMDVDGTLTDGKIYMGENGEIMKAFNIKDGYAIHDLLPRKGIVPVWITARKSSIVSRRAAELGVSLVYQGVRDKLAILREIAFEQGVSLDEIAYIGDDIGDMECMEACGYSGCPSDAVEGVKALANYVCQKPGGAGAVREFTDHIIGCNKGEIIC